MAAREGVARLHLLAGQVQRNDCLRNWCGVWTEGIDSMSLNPDAVVRTTLAVLEMEREQAAPRGSPPPPVLTRSKPATV